MTISHSHTGACIDAWITCEELLSSIANSTISKKITQLLDECATICMATIQAIKSKSKNISHIALLCVGICEECAEACEKSSDEAFQNCAVNCRQCSEAMTQLAFTALQ